MSLLKNKKILIALSFLGAIIFSVYVVFDVLIFSNMSSDLAKIMGINQIKCAGIVRQTKREDCGIACMKMVDLELGRDNPYSTYLKGTPLSPSGVSMGSIVEYFQKEGATIDAFKGALPKNIFENHTAIVWVNHNHFVVVDGFQATKGYRVMDPAQGCYWVPQFLMRRWESGYYLSISKLSYANQRCFH